MFIDLDQNFSLTYLDQTFEITSLFDEKYRLRPKFRLS